MILIIKINNTNNNNDDDDDDDDDDEDDDDDDYCYYCYEYYSCYSYIFIGYLWQKSQNESLISQEQQETVGGPQFAAGLPLRLATGPSVAGRPGGDRCAGGHPWGEAHGARAVKPKGHGGATGGFLRKSWGWWGWIFLVYFLSLRVLHEG